MNKPGQGGSELHVQGKWAHLILQWPDLAKYLRKNSGVKDYRPTTTARHAGPLRVGRNVQRPLTTRIDRVELRLNHFAHELRESSPWLPAKYFADLVRFHYSDQPA